MTKRFGLIHFGTDEVYGLIFVNGALKRQGHTIRWFDGESPDVLRRIAEWKPDFVCFSPLMPFFEKSLELSRDIKKSLPDVRSVFGGRHISGIPDCINTRGVDIVVIGPVHGTIEQIIEAHKKEVIRGQLVPVENMVPERQKYYDDIPRVGRRHRKILMSYFGCAYNCSYCSISNLRDSCSQEDYQKYYMTRRPVQALIDEAKIFLRYPTKEVSIEDADMLFGNNIGAWLKEFAAAWKKKIGISISGNVAPLTVTHVPDKTLEILSSLVSSVRMGVQTARKESLRLFNRLGQDEKVVKSAYERLTFFDIPVKMEFIMGLPVKNPVDDAIESIKMAQRIAPGTFISAFPLMVYPKTELALWCKRHNIKLNQNAAGEWYTGVGSIKFDPVTAKRIRNLVKMASMFAKYNIDERWMRALIDMDLTEESSKALSQSQYFESLVFRQVGNAEDDFKKIIRDIHFRY